METMRRRHAQDELHTSRVNNELPCNSGRDDDQLDSNNRTTEMQTMMHILKANIGTGVLAMPLAFKNVGLWLGLVLVPFIGVICIHCMNILISSHNKLCDKFNYESLDYDQVAALGLACGPKWARRVSKRASVIVTTFLMFTQIGFCCVYILFTVENLQVACMNLFQLEYPMLTYLLVIFPIIGLTSCTSNLKHLARISTLANVLQLAGLALILFDLLQFHTYANTNDLDEQPAVGNNSAISSDQVQLNIKVEQSVSSSDLLSGLPLFFATAVYAFEGIGVVLPLVKEMQHPARISGLNGVLNTSMSMVALLYMAMGFFGYSKYGQTVAGSITLNLPRTTLNELVRLAFAIAIGLSYSLQFYVPWTIVWPWIDETLFYSYRPRVARNKLSILDELSASNHWALSKVLEEKQRTEVDMEGGGSAGVEVRQAQGCSAPEGATIDQQASTTTDYNEFNDNSMASTLATSYSMSVSVAVGHRQGAHLKSLTKSTSLSLARQLQPPGQQYGALAEGEGKPLAGARLSLTQQQQQQQHATSRHRRNRLEDVMEASSDELPEVQWRPPPRSMRGKRKLVRYTVILLTVSFTFVAAALIPRLDLFISLIGALASSSLAIIFPAIIQLCTFWNGGRPAHNFQDGQSPEGRDNEDEDEEEEADAADKRNEHQPGTSGQGCECCCRHNRPSNAKLAEASLSPLLPDCRHCRSRRRRRWQNSILWHLFVLKNMLLVLFGVLGLITGTWVSLNQLSANSEQV